MVTFVADRKYYLLTSFSLVFLQFYVKIIYVIGCYYHSFCFFSFYMMLIRTLKNYYKINYLIIVTNLFFFFTVVHKWILCENGSFVSVWLHNDVIYGKVGFSCNLQTVFLCLDISYWT